MVYWQRSFHSQDFALFYRYIEWCFVDGEGTWYTVLLNPKLRLRVTLKTNELSVLVFIVGTGNMLLLWEKRRLLVPILVIATMSVVSVIYITRQSRNVNDAIIVTVADRKGSINKIGVPHVRSIPIPTDDNESIITRGDAIVTEKVELLPLPNVTNSSNVEIEPQPDSRDGDQSSEQSEITESSSNTQNHDSKAYKNDGDGGLFSVQPEMTEISSYVESDLPNNSTNENDIANKTVISWEGVSGMHNIVTRYWKGNLFCETIDQVRSAAADPNLPITANLSFSCKELYEKSELGSGNFIALFYGIRMAAHVYGNVDLFIVCDDANDTKNDLILPWITGYFPARPMDLNSSIPITVKEACGSYVNQPLAYMYNEIQHDLRRMTVGLMGVPTPEHASAIFAEKHLWSDNAETPLIEGHLTLENPRRDDKAPFPASEYPIDDAVLHFRCGDLMDSKHPSFAFMKFSGYTRHISPEAKTIGILTQPFDSSTQSRKADSGQYKRDRCRTVVYSLVEYINARFPNASVRIHNEAGETIALTFARMIMANQTIAGISSFGVIPAVSTFGTGYIRKPDYHKAPNMWLINPRIDELTDNIILFDEPNKIMVGAMKGLWQNEGERGVLEWFWNDTAR